MDLPRADSGVASMSRFFQSRSTVPIAIFIGLLSCGFLIPGIQAFNGTKKNPAQPLLGAVGVTVGVLLLSWCIGVLARAGVKTTQSGITIRNRFRKYSVPWEHIETFRFKNESMTQSNPVPYAVLKDGRRIPMVGLSAVRNMGKRSRQNVQAILNDLERIRNSSVTRPSC
jgi:hypothetical protein